MTKLGKYEILEEIGRGGFATVYQARDPDLDRVVALKVLHPYWTADPGFVARFRREARAAARLHHPHIVTVYETGEAEGQLYIAMEHLPGRSLRDLLEAKGALALERALPMLEQVAEALDYAHAQGVVHRDVKPGNVIVEETGRGVRATLMDFGLVKAMEGSSTLTSQGTLLGSPEYMAPEQADPERAAEIGPATDRYALGIVAYQVLTGRVPFPGNTPATLNAHLNLDPPDPRAICEDVSPDVAAALLKMLAKAPAGRFASAGAFVARLREALLAEGRAREREAQLAPLYERLEAAAAREDWAEVLALGGRVQALDASYRDVPQWMERARERLRRPQRRPVPAWAWIAGGVAVLALLVGLLGWGLGWWPKAAPTRVAYTGATTEEPTEMPTKAPTEAPAEVPTEEPAPSAGDTWVRPADEMVMVYVLAGEFEMGSTEGGSDEQPVHTVALDGFWIDQTEVTNAQYTLCVADGACEESAFADDARYNGGDYPVVGVSWHDAAGYCAWAGARLPTEAEWEYAARGPDGYVYPWGNDFDCSRGNFDDETQVDDYVVPGGEGCDGYERTAPVGRFRAGESWCGALDMAGNVWEWVADWYGDHPSGRQANPTGPSFGEYRVLRGGSWGNVPHDVRSAYRSRNVPDIRDDYRGFRCARGSE